MSLACAGIERKLPRQVDSSEVETFWLNTLGRNTAGRMPPGAYQLYLYRYPHTKHVANEISQIMTTLENNSGIFCSPRGVRNCF